MNTLGRHTASGTTVPIGRPQPQPRHSMKRRAWPHFNKVQSFRVSATTAEIAYSNDAMPTPTAAADHSNVRPGAPIVRETPLSANAVGEKP